MNVLSICKFMSEMWMAECQNVIIITCSWTLGCSFPLPPQGGFAFDLFRSFFLDFLDGPVRLWHHESTTLPWVDHPHVHRSIGIDGISISALRSFAMQPPFVLLFIGYMGMALPLISSMFSSLWLCYLCLFIRFCSSEPCSSTTSRSVDHRFLSLCLHYSGSHLHPFKV